MCPNCADTVLLLFCINFQYLVCFFSINFFIKATYVMYVQNVANFSVFSKFVSINLCSEFSNNSGKSVYLEAMFSTGKFFA